MTSNPTTFERLRAIMDIFLDSKLSEVKEEEGL